MPTEQIKLRCDRCGYETLAPRLSFDPENASTLCTNFCPQCERSGDDFMTDRYEDDAGEDIPPSES